jgi:hypothetical protein
VSIPARDHHRHGRTIVNRVFGAVRLEFYGRRRLYHIEEGYAFHHVLARVKARPVLSSGKT